VDNARKKAETGAFDKLIPEIEKLWSDVLKTHIHTKAATALG
jgi:hypothetical protein